MECKREPIFLIGYNIQAQDPETWEKTLKFLKICPLIHRELDIPCTFFICGKTLEDNPEEFLKIRENYSDLIDFQQRTYSNIRFKEIRYFRKKPLLTPQGEVIFQEGETILPGEEPHRIVEEVRKTNLLMGKILGVKCSGITAPYGFPKGLKDRPDLLYLLFKEGIKFVRSWKGTDEKWDPINATPLSIQPFFYGEWGYPEIMEFPIHMVDNINRERYGWENRSLYFSLVKAKMEKAVEGRLVFSYSQHDYSTVEGDENMELTYKILEEAKKMGFQFYTYWHYYMREVSRSRLERMRGW